MAIATLTSKGQIPLPIDARAASGLEAGSQVDFVPCDGSFLLIPLHSDVGASKSPQALKPWTKPLRQVPQTAVKNPHDRL